MRSPKVLSGVTATIAFTKSLWLSPFVNGGLKPCHLGGAKVGYLRCVSELFAGVLRHGKRYQLRSLNVRIPVRMRPRVRGFATPGGARDNQHICAVGRTAARPPFPGKPVFHDGFARPCPAHRRLHGLVRRAKLVVQRGGDGPHSSPPPMVSPACLNGTGLCGLRGARFKWKMNSSDGVRLPLEVIRQARPVSLRRQVFTRLSSIRCAKRDGS